MARSMKTASATLAAILLAGAWQTAEASAASTALSAIREAYTSNAICKKNNCINPIFPGMEDLHRLQQANWMTSSLQKVAPSLGFCKNAITYDPALPAPDGDGTSIKQMVQRQDNAASTAFYYHASGLGLEAWDYQKPEFASDCVKSIWRMTCFTYFPRAEVGSQDGAISKFIRPCQSSCMNYVRSCGVECCDESVQCVFSHTKTISLTQKVTSEGYLPHDGPSSLCTGGAHRGASPLGLGIWVLMVLKVYLSFDSMSASGSARSLFAGLGGRRLFWISSVAVMALSLQGCDYDVPIHTVANWRAEPDYLVRYQYEPPGGSKKPANLNSCSYQGLAPSLQCSGRGQCKSWAGLDNPLAFCQCDTQWADPECRTKRKSQTVAYLLSIFAGFLGADHFYLGYPLWATLKLLITLFGALFYPLFGLMCLSVCGVWWIYDIVRIGSAPVFASGTHRCAADLSHSFYVLSCVMVAMFVGFSLSHYLTSKYRAEKRQQSMKLQLDEESREKFPDTLWKSKPFGDAYRTAQHGQGRPVIAEFQDKLSNGWYGAVEEYSRQNPVSTEFKETGQRLPSFGGSGP